MIIILTRVLLATFFLGVLGTLPAQEAPLQQLITNPKAPTQLQREMRLWRWFGERQRPLFEARVKGQAWAGKALEWVDHCLLALSEGAAEDEAVPLLAEAGEVVFAGCRDPLFRYLQLEMSHLGATGAATTRDGLYKLWEELVVDSLGDAVMPPGLAFQCGITFRLRSMEMGELASLCGGTDLARLLSRSLNAGDYKEADFPLLAMQVCKQSCGDWLDEQVLPLLLIDVKPEVALPEWMRELFTGVAATATAWHSRGNDVASTVTEEGWQGFKTHLTEARRALLKAWELRPDCPEPAACMLIVVKGGQGPPGDTPHLWLQRALSACVDHPDSLWQYLSILQPKWGGSRAEIIRFAVECAATRRYDTQIAEAVYGCFDGINEEAPAGTPSIYETPQVGRLVLELAKGRAASPALIRQRNSRLSDYAVMARLCNSPAEVTAALSALKGPLSPYAHLRIAALGLDEHRLRLEAAALSSAGGPRLKALRELRRLGQPEATLSEYSALLAGLPENARDARAWLSLCLEEAGFEAKLRTQEWASVPARGNLLSWVPRGGAWRAGEGVLAEVRGTGGPARLVLASDLPKNYEFELGLAREGPPAFLPIGIAVKYAYAGHYRDTWEGLFFDQEASNPGTRAGYARNDLMAPEASITALPATFTLKGSYRNRTLQCSLNGKKLDLSVLIPGPHPPLNRFAICAAMLAPGETLKIVSLKFRQPAP